jgi:hypothetical protein
MFHVSEVAQVCAWQAAHRYQVPYGEMLGILHTEGGGYGVIDVDSNGTEDLGWAQINSCHLPFLHRFGITKQVLLTNPCVNIAVGAYILRRAYNDTGNWFTAAQAYNAGARNLAAGYGYAMKVFQAWRDYAEKRPYSRQHWTVRTSAPSRAKLVAVVARSPFSRENERHHFISVTPGDTNS